MAGSADHIRNVAIVAHVDHGKTTLVDQLLRQSGSLRAHGESGERMMDSNALERERGITILAKNTAIDWMEWTINIVDTPGHADFGGEVERALSMVDSVLLLVDAVEGPMPQTTFVTRKALALGLKPIVVVNKVDRPAARPEWVVEQTFDLFDRLGATHDQLDFPVIYASATEGWASTDPRVRDGGMTALFQTIVDFVPPPEVDLEGPLQMQVSALDYSSYVGVIGIARIRRGRLRRNTQVVIANADGGERRGRVLQILAFHGLERVELDEASAGDIIAFTGVDGLKISDTICDPEVVEPLPALLVDEPTISMTFQVNDSPLGGREGKYVTSRNLRARLDEELIHNVALRVEPAENPDKFKVSGRGELHLAILIENMRREGYELAISRPEVILKTIDGEVREPWETLTVDVEEQHQGAVMERLGRAAWRGQRYRAGRARPGASRLPDSDARPDRLPLGILDGHIRHRSHLSRFRALRPTHRGGSRPAGERRAGVDGDRQGGSLRALQPPGARKAVRRPQHRRLRRHGHRHPCARQRPLRQSYEDQAAHQHPRRRLRREHHPGPADRHHA